jgi:hypothetical protein
MQPRFGVRWLDSALPVGGLTPNPSLWARQAAPVQGGVNPPHSQERAQ